jgi:hypothetical protein
MLMLLGRSGRVPESFSALPWTTHPDARVRVEAIRLQLTLPHERDLVFTPPSTTSIRIVHVGLTRSVTIVRPTCSDASSSWRRHRPGPTRTSADRRRALARMARAGARWRCCRSQTAVDHFWDGKLLEESRAADRDSCAR